MSKQTAATVAEHAVRVGLLTPSQLQECPEFTEQREGPPDALLRALERKSFLTPWQSQKLLKGDSDGFFLGGFRVLYRIASGSFGRVFRADDPHSGEIVAIKVLRKRWSEERRTIDLFEREGKVGRALRHPNIVSILAVDRDPASQQYYIVMEFVEGGNLRDFLAIRKKLTAAESLRIIEDAASGLTYAQSQGITHRDIKLTNLLISTQGTAKLVDFGLAGIYTAETEGQGKKMYRTVDYAGLERATGAKPGDVRSDIFFLGCVLYEMLTGKSPLDTPADPRARMKKQRFDQIVSLLKPEEIEAPPGVFHLLKTMLAYNPADRYQTPAQLLDAVRDVRAEMEGGTHQPVEKAPAERSVFLVEKNARFQEAFRDALKKRGYRVFLSTDPTVALNRYRLKPFDAIIIDAAGADQDSVTRFDQILDEAAKQRRACAGVLLLAENQDGWARNVEKRPNSAILVRPLTLRQVVEKLGELVAGER
jgi:tRNA A-37 threonylcarbamoyl transferase component Bud32/CheY-like chemotaxis protein